MLLREWKHTWTFHNGDVAEEEIALDGIINTSGMIQSIVIVAGDCTNAATLTVNIENTLGVALYTRAAIAKNATTVLTAASEAPNPSPEVIFADGGNFGLTPTDPGSDWSVTIYVYYVTDEAEVNGKLPKLVYDRNGVGVQGSLCPISTLRMAFGDTSVQSLPFALEVKVIRVMATQDCYICFVDKNTLAVATLYDMPLKASIVEYFSVRQGIIGIAAIRASADGFLYITSMA